MNSKTSMKSNTEENHHIIEQNHTVIKLDPIGKSEGNIKVAGVLSFDDFEGGENYILQNKEGESFRLDGKIEGLNKYIGKKLEVTGKINDVMDIFMMGKSFKVESFKPIIMEKNQEAKSQKYEIT